MDANGLKFWLLADEQHWRLLGDPPVLEYDAQRRSLRLARQRRELNLNEAHDKAKVRLETVPQARDSHGNRAWYDAALRSILSVGVSDTPVLIYHLEGTAELTDMALGDDGVLYMAVGDAVIMHDRRQRWRDAVVSTNGFSAWRLTPAPDGGAWVLDRDNRQLARLMGYPISNRAYKPYTPETVRPCSENANPPRLEVLADVEWPAAETPVALACSLRGEVALLSWVNAGINDGEAALRLLTGQLSLSYSMRLLGSQFPYTLAWVATGRAGVLVCGETNDTLPEPKSEARVYKFDASEVADGASHQYPSGDLYPIKIDYNHGPFIHGLDYPPHYPLFKGSHALRRLSFPFFTRQGEAFNTALIAPLDSGAVDTVWHRLYIEAVIPQGCGIRLWLAASNEVVDPDEINEADWYEHRFGERYQQGGRGDIPVGSWASLASELPHHPGLLPCAREAERKGLFTVLIQRPGRKVRALRGRYLTVRVELVGPGNATPELFAARAYGGRFSYVEHYLPKLYWEKRFPPEADDAGSATEADFLERFINNFEGVMTTLEDRVAYSDLVTRPQTAPAEALEWLASWVGFQLEAGWSESKQRAFLARTAELYQWHGTLRGLRLALELATEGGVSGGEIVVLEDYRLRRTFATIIGANLDDKDDPLTLGGIESGNSFVGDTLIIGDEQRREFLALFSTDLDVTNIEQLAIDAFFDKLAFRVTILVHQNVTPQDLGAIQRIAEREVPAHVEFRILPTTAPLLAGITALVGVDTYLSPRQPPRPARVNRSYVGRGDYVMGPASLDPRLERTGSGRPELSGQKPIARADDLTAEYGANFTLDGSASEAASGRTLTSYHWSSINNGNK